MVGLISVASRAGAWNESGHRQIALSAYERLPPAERAAWLAVLQRHPRYREDFLGRLPPRLAPGQRGAWLFSQAAVWPDIARGQPRYHRADWHYVNQRLELRRAGLGECPPIAPVERPASEAQVHHLPAALEWARATLRRQSAPAAQQAIALSWLLHLVGDAHQPLHTVAVFGEGRLREGDRGGNLVRVRGGKTLHHYWDGLLGDGRSMRSVYARARRLPEPPSAPAAAGWLSEGCALARQRVYVAPLVEALVRFQHGRSARAPFRPSQAYRKAATEAARSRASVAAARLAAELGGLHSGHGATPR